MAKRRMRIGGTGAPRYGAYVVRALPVQRQWMCRDDGDIITSESEYCAHIARNPAHRVTTQI